MDTIVKRIFMVDKYITKSEIENIEESILTQKIGSKIDMIIGSTEIEKIKYLVDYKKLFENFKTKLNFGCKDQTIDNFLNRLPTVTNYIKSMSCNFKIQHIYVNYSLEENVKNEVKTKLNNFFPNSKIHFIDSDEIIEIASYIKKIEDDNEDENEDKNEDNINKIDSK